jgi:hypothetical protein
MSLSMQAFHSRLFSSRVDTVPWAGLTRLTLANREALSQLALFWFAW